MIEIILRNMQKDWIMTMQLAKKRNRSGVKPYKSVFYVAKVSKNKYKDIDYVYAAFDTYYLAKLWLKENEKRLRGGWIRRWLSPLDLRISTSNYFYLQPTYNERVGMIYE